MQLTIWEKAMTTEAIEERQHSRRAKASAPAGKNATASRLSDIGTSGLGAQEGDLKFFLGLDPIEQSRLIRDGMEAVVVSRIANELLNIPLQSLLASLRLPSSTINRKISQGERLSASESDRAARTLLIYAQARDVLEDDKLAGEWPASLEARVREWGVPPAATFFLVRVEVPKRAVPAAYVPDLRDDWNALDRDPASTVDIARKWLEDGKRLVMRVPSVVCPND